MESLVHHFKLVTEGFHARRPGLPDRRAREGHLWQHPSPMVARPFPRTSATPSFANLQALAMMTERLKTWAVAPAAIDPVRRRCWTDEPHPTPAIAQQCRRDHRPPPTVTAPARLPLLHLIQSVDGYVSPNGIDLSPR